MDQLSEAVVLWTGRGLYSSPRRDESRLVERFGEERAIELLPQVLKLYEDFYASDARHVARDLNEMGDLAEDRFRQLHPELDEEAVRALGWCYTWDYK